MKRQEKLVFLRNFNEQQLIANVIRPLLEAMGFKNITLTHGATEKGIDLVFYKENEFGEREYTGVQVKAVKIHGRAGQKGNAIEISNQAQMAFKHEFPDISDNRPKNIDRFRVITSCEITDAAKEIICEQVKSKAIQFIDGDRLVDLMTKYMPDFFWEEYNYFNRYFKAMKKDFETIKDISAIGQKEPISLEDIYVSLRLSEELREREIPLEMRDKIFDEKWIEKEKKPERAIKKTRVIDPDTAVKQFHRVVILGVPGAGKTTLLKHLALKFCKENIEKQERMIVPIPITLRQFSESGKGLREYIDAVFERYGFPEAKKFVEKDLKAGKCILLLDGFDELAARENQKRVAKEIHAFLEQYHGCRVLVTSRIAGYHDELSGFTRVEVMEFDKDQIKRFIHNWFGPSLKKKAESMLKAVMENENIKAMAKNPLMISIIAIIYEEDQELPQRRADLYKRAIDVLLSKWDIRKKLENRFKAEKKSIF